MYMKRSHFMKAHKCDVLHATEHMHKNNYNQLLPNTSDSSFLINLFLKINSLTVYTRYIRFYIVYICGSHRKIINLVISSTHMEAIDYAQFLNCIDTNIEVNHIWDRCRSISLIFVVRPPLALDILEMRDGRTIKHIDMLAHSSNCNTT